MDCSAVLGEVALAVPFARRLSARSGCGCGYRVGRMRGRTGRRQTHVLQIMRQRRRGLLLENESGENKKGRIKMA